ncbi:transcriptional regulator VisN [Pararhizobium haloflavum]|uniref:transcriptional regulator VisN n=1 Tax=Pararhizobium haloflavum TaxID=2037914 RepID=UPI001FE0488B|nr:helix-turn-helix transcriptional regulator [Pararhizobium haloflavum]
MIGRTELLQKLELTVERNEIAAGLELLSAFVGAEHYLLARYDVFAEDGYDYVVSSNWPFDLLRSLGAVVARQQSKRNEVERCMAAMEPEFVRCGAGIRFPAHLSRTYCAVTFNAGQARLMLVLLFRDDVVRAQDRLHDAALIGAYYAARFDQASFVPESVLDLTDREIECLNWIAEGKTSDEISMIIGISRNTVNNYITSIMRKTSTKTRSEAIAYAVRNGLI